MNLRSVALAAAILTLSVAAHAASAVVVSKTIPVKGKSAAEVFAKFGAFCAIQEWHPAVAKCEETKEGNDTFRTLTLKDGAKIKEKLLSKADTSYSYAIVESPLPVKDYTATFGAKTEGDATVLNWQANFDAKDKPEAEAKQVIEGIFDGGLKSIAEKAAN